MELYSRKDVDKKALKGARVAVLGYGSQGRAQALNLKDSGFKVVVGVRKGGASWKRAKKDGLAVAQPADAVANADVIAMLVPDMAQRELYRAVRDKIRKHAMLLFAHGFAIHFKSIQPPADIDVSMVAPKAPGHTVRATYTQGGGVPHLIAVYADKTGKARDLALSYATANGGGRAGIIETNFREETETDLFGEQAVLCGGTVELIKAGFETLVEAGADQFRGTAAQDGLFAEQVALRLFAEARFEYAGAHGADAGRISQTVLQRLAARILMHGDERGYA